MLYAGPKKGARRRPYCTNASLLIGACATVCITVAPLFFAPMLIGMSFMLLALAALLAIPAFLCALTARWRGERNHHAAWLGPLPGVVAATVLTFLLYRFSS